jgi:hypothetical protein
MKKLQDRQDLDKLIEAGSFGHFPLFFDVWIRESFLSQEKSNKITFSRAAEHVHQIFDQIEKHRSIERKKIAIQAMKKEERDQFILSFMKMVEFKTLDTIKELH